MSKRRVIRGSFTKNQESKILREFPSLGIFEYLTYHCESKVLSPVRNFRDCTFAIIRRVNSPFSFSSISMERHFSDSHDINVKFTEKVVELEENPSRLERDFFFSSSFSLTFRFIIQGNLYYISQLWEKFFLFIDVFFFIFPYVSIFIYLQWRNETFVYLKFVWLF